MTNGIRPGETILRERYQLLEGPLLDDPSSQSWVGVEQQEETPYLIKLWPYNGETPDGYQRALWDAELRTLYRVGSSPGAERSLLVDEGCRCGQRLQLLRDGARKLAARIRDPRNRPCAKAESRLALRRRRVPSPSRTLAGS